MSFSINLTSFPCFCKFRRLPEPENDSPKARQLLELYENLINCGVEFEAVTGYAEAYLVRLNTYLNHTIRTLQLPLA